MEPATSRLLITAHPTDGARREELELCLGANEAAFDEVAVISEGAAKPEWSKAKWIERTNRQKFSDLLRDIGHFAKRDDVTLIANSDIVIPKWVVSSIAANLGPLQVYCLAKWDLTPGGIRKWKSGWSQDVWCFRGVPEFPSSVGDYCLGVPGCDNRFARELHDAGFEVSNPSLSLPTYHVHLSSARTSTNTEPHRVPAPYALIRSHYLGDTPQIELLETFVAKRGSGSNALWRNRLRTRTTPRPT